MRQAGITIREGIQEVKGNPRNKDKADLKVTDSLLYLVKKYLYVKTSTTCKKTKHHLDKN